MSLQNRAVALVLASAATGSLYPILGKLSAAELPPLGFGAFSTIIACVAGALWLTVRKEWQWVSMRRCIHPLLMNTFFNIVLPFVLFYIGVRMTSGLHATLLLLFEIPFTVLITPFFGESTTRAKLLGCGLVFFGAAAILWQGQLSMSLGDVLIIASTALYPFGNFYGKKCLLHLKPATIVFARSLLGGIMLLAVSLFVEGAVFADFSPSSWWLIAVNGALVFGLGKIFWFAGFRELDISKAVALIKTEPLFALALVVIVLKEQILWYQWIGAVIMIVGAYVSILRPSVPIERTRYSS